VFEQPPRLRGFGGCAASLDRAATPPGLEGQGAPCGFVHSLYAR